MERVNLTVNAIVTLSAERALEEAKRMTGRRTGGEADPPFLGAY